jgi:hypothetical protein
LYDLSIEATYEEQAVARYVFGGAGFKSRRDIDNADCNFSLFPPSVHLRRTLELHRILELHRMLELHCILELHHMLELHRKLELHRILELHLIFDYYPFILRPF